MSSCPKDICTLNDRHAVGAATISVLFLLFFLFSCFLVRGQHDPNYNWKYKVDLPTVSGSSLNTEDITIALAQDRIGNIYTLSLGNGIDKRDPEGNLLQKQFIPPVHLDSPRDLVVDDDGFIYVADYLAGGDDFKDDGKIRVFDPSGTPLPERTILTSFYRPLGLALSGNHVFVAEYYDGLQGPEKGSTFSRVRVYDSTTGIFLQETEKVDIPLRIAVNSSGTVYVSQAGSNPAIVMFDKEFEHLGQLPNIISPGSVIVDALDFIHVLEYGSRVNFSDFIRFESLSLIEISTLAEDISTGVKNEEFFLKVFNPDGTHSLSLTSEIDFPVDLSQEGCGELFIDNSEIFDGSFFGMYVPSKLEFDLEVYDRIPSIDATEGPEISCSEDIEVAVQPGETDVAVTFSLPTATDNCGVIIRQTAGPESGDRFPLGETIIEFTAEDTAGNANICSFTILVKGQEVAPQFSDCPSDFEVTADQGACGAVLQFEIPQAFDELGEVVVKQIRGLPSGSLFPVGETKQAFEAIDGQGNISTCRYTITVIDSTAPEAKCPENLEFFVDFGVQGRIVEYEAPSSKDTCPEVSVQQTSGLASGVEFPIGTTENIFVFTDASSNYTICSFLVTITEKEDTEAPQILCPTNISVPADPETCTAIANYDLPAASDNSGEVKLSLLEGPEKGEPIGVGLTVVKFLATDAAGNTTSCEFTITVVDDTTPIIKDCPGDQQQVVSADGFLLPDYTKDLTVRDCSKNITLKQIPAAGTTIFKTTLINIAAEDEEGNVSAECSFELVLLPEEILEITFCPEGFMLEVDSGCEAYLPDLTSEVTTNVTAEVVQEPAVGTMISGDTTVRITATDSEGNTDSCEVVVTVQDTQVPELSCPGNKEFSFDPKEGFVVPDFRNLAEASDHCQFKLTQDPEPGTRIYLGQMVVLTATDSSGNENFCDFELALTEEPLVVVKITSCPEGFMLEMDSGCEAFLPDLTLEVTTNVTAEVVQEPAVGTVISGDTTVRFTATDSEGNTDSCEVVVTVQDTQVPEIICIGDTTATLNSEEGFLLPDYRPDISVTENCEDILVVQEPAPGTTLRAGQVISFTATDASGNSAVCSFWLYLSEEKLPLSITCPGKQEREFDKSCGYLVEDFTTMAAVNMENAVVTQEPKAGTHLYEASQITLTASKEGEVVSCTFGLDLKDSEPPQAVCAGTIILRLDEQGTATITADGIDGGSTDNCQIVSKSLSKSSFTTADVGEQVIILTVTDAQGNKSSCEATIIIEAYNDPGITCVEGITLQLDGNRRASLDPRELFSGGSGTIQYSVDKEEFSCADLGKQKIAFSYATPTEEGTCEIMVTVEDPGSYCNFASDDPEDPPFVIISPNPGFGLVEIFTSEGIEIHRLEVYDMRGRFLMARNISEGYAGDHHFYTLDLRQYQSGIYTLKLETSTGIFIRRAIIKND